MAYPLCVVNVPLIGRAENLQGTTMASDTTRLTRAIVTGDETAFSEFYDRYSGRLFGFLLVLTSGQEDAARELHQIAMVKVARKFKVIATEAELWAWLAQVARNARFVPLACAHNDCPPDWREFWRILADFLRAQGIVAEQRGLTH